MVSSKWQIIGILNQFMPRTLSHRMKEKGLVEKLLHQVQMPHKRLECLDSVTYFQKEYLSNESLRINEDLPSQDRLNPFDTELIELLAKYTVSGTDEKGILHVYRIQLQYRLGSAIISPPRISIFFTLAN